MEIQRLELEILDTLVKKLTELEKVCVDDKTFAESVRRIFMFINSSYLDYFVDKRKQHQAEIDRLNNEIKELKMKKKEANAQSA